jgi:hypothetical protein
MFCYSIRKQVAAMIAALDGVDLLVFTGGIGEHDAKVRAAICGGLSWLGISLDTRNRSLEDPISNPTSRCSVRVLPLGRRRADRHPYLGTRLAYFVIRLLNLSLLKKCDPRIWIAVIGPFGVAGLAGRMVSLLKQKLSSVRATSRR